MSKEEFVKYVCDQYRDIFKNDYKEEVAKDSAEKLWNSCSNPEDCKAAADAVIADTRKKVENANFKSELHDALGNIKEALFNAPTEVKGSFNDIVNYFSNEDFTAKGTNPSELKLGDKVILDKYFKNGGEWEKYTPRFNYNLGPNTIKSIERKGERFLVILEADNVAEGRTKSYHPKTRLVVDNSGVTKTAYTESDRIPYRYVITK